jgi:hypothetical protein
MAGLAVLVLAFAVSAQAQGSRSVRVAISPSTLHSSGGGSAGGASSGGFHHLTHYAPARFAVQVVTGDATDYIPSTFVPYQTALAEGQTVLASPPQPLGTFARQNSKPAPRKAKIELEQDHHGDAVIRTR